MLKTRIFAGIAALLFAVAAHSQSPTDGHIAGKTYVNSYFHITYTWPSMLKPMNMPAPAANSGGVGAYLFPLFAAHQGDQPYGVVLVAEKLNVAGPHSTGIKSSGEYVDKVAHSLKAGTILTNITRSQKKNAHGMVFEELSYLQSGKPSSIMATQIGQYLLVFKNNAQSPADIAQMEKAALSVRVSK